MCKLENDILRNTLAQLCGINDFKTTDSLTADLGLDSLERVTLMVMLEEAFKIEFLVSDLDPFALSTVGDIKILLSKYIPGGES